MIPPRIIQTAKTKDLSPLARASAVNLKLLHPEWDYSFYDDAAVLEFIATECPEFSTVFHQFPFKIQRFDFFRYLAVYRRGGFYFDLDVLLSEPLDPLLPYSCVLPFEEITLNRHLRESLGMDWEVGNYAFGARAGDPFLAQVIQNCVRSQKDASWTAPMMRGIPRWFRKDFEVLNSTGPGMLTRTLAENPDLHSGVHVLFPEDVHNRLSWHQFGSLGTHLMEGSWRDQGSFLHRKLAYKWEYWARNRGMAASRQLGPKRSLPGLQAPAAPH
jgi:hypothetical protein